MHILPLILATWSYRQRVDRAIMGEQATAIGDMHERGQLALTYGETGLVVQRTKSTGLTKFERASVRTERTADPIDYTKQATNEVRGSHFMTTELCHVGTDAWGSLKNRLAENGIIIDDEKVRVAAAGFWAEHKMQEITGRRDKKRLREELEGDVSGVDEFGEAWASDARWIREINAHPDAEAIALECFEDLKHHYPMALGVDMRHAEKAIGYDKNVIDAEFQ